MHLLLDDGRYRKVAAAAARQDISVAAVIRQAIDQLPDDGDRRRAAIDAILGAPRISVPADPADLRRELDRSHDRLG
jgi:hypothetical protein